MLYLAFLYFSRLGSWLFCLVLVSLAHEDVLGHQLKLWLFLADPFRTHELSHQGIDARKEHWVDKNLMAEILKTVCAPLHLVQLCRCLSDTNRDSWLRPFSTVLWLTLMATACIVFVVIWCLDRKSPQGYYQMLKGSDEDGFTLLGKLTSWTVTRNY